MFDPHPGEGQGASGVTRREELLREAALLFAHHGYRAVGINDIGAAVGISGPAIYRYFRSKESVLAELLVGISEYLHEGARAIVRSAPDPLIATLIGFHLDFSMGYPEMIVLHERELQHLDESSTAVVRRHQRAYVEIWVGVLQDDHPELTTAEARLRARACFGLLNSTPRLGQEESAAAEVLARMASAALHTP